MKRNAAYFSCARARARARGDGGGGGGDGDGGSGGLSAGVQALAALVPANISVSKPTCPVS